MSLQTASPEDEGDDSDDGDDGDDDDDDDGDAEDDDDDDDDEFVVEEEDDEHGEDSPCGHDRAYKLIASQLQTDWKVHFYFITANSTASRWHG